jgi:hypothetical protein
MTELHLKYAPILRFAAPTGSTERFYPMRVEDYIAYSALYAKGQDAPLLPRGQVTPDRLADKLADAGTFLRSVDTGPKTGTEVVSQWGKHTVELVYQWSNRAPSEWRSINWTERTARAAYKWFSEKTSAATQLFWWNQLLAPVLNRATSATDDGLPRLTLPQETRDAAAERYVSHLGRTPPYTYYYRQVRDGNYLCLQYWFFYSYNDWGCSFEGMNDHEGDWESMLFFFPLDAAGRPQEPPAYVTFVGHHSRLTKPWDHGDVQRFGTHVVGNVAAGSHATYPEARPYPIIEMYNLIDYATADGPVIDHDDWGHRIHLDDVPWLAAYRGSWGTRFWLSLDRMRAMMGIAFAVGGAPNLAPLVGQREIELPGVSAPHGPMIGDTGEKRPQWAGPVEWAGVPPA